MAYVLIFLMFVVSLAVQGSVLALVGTSGTHPDILLVVTVGLALLMGARRGAIVGLCAGLLQDILFGAPLGFFAAIKMLTGALAGMMSDDIYKDFTLAPMVLMLVFTLFSDIFTFFLTQLYHIQLPLSLLSYLREYTLLRMVMQFFIMGLIYPYLYRAQKRGLLLTVRDSEE
ncbi:MAG: rod shape-determining protein MreD [Firmicutes bacterium]|nr:rod shape-determining protein MreD [Bacillota bacterium]